MSEARVTEDSDPESVGFIPAEVTEAVAPVESDTPGAVLRRTREARGQSIADVVQVIRFSAHQIEALERDDYASLPGLTSTRGMVRNYARFLKLDATPLLARLEPAVPLPVVEVRPPANMGEAERLTIVERIPGWIVAAGAVLLLLLLAGYWYSRLGEDGELADLSRGAAGSSGEVSRTPVAAPVVAPVIASAPVAIAEKQPGTVGMTSSAPPFGGLRVEFDDRSWIEIRDATQKVVFVGEYPAGTRQNVEGKAPFQVWIGKASGVRVFMGERSIDLTPYVREDIARLVVQ